MHGTPATSVAGVYSFMGLVLAAKRRFARPYPELLHRSRVSADHDEERLTNIAKQRPPNEERT
jgi:hypothetical protein